MKSPAIRWLVCGCLALAASTARADQTVVARVKVHNPTGKAVCTVVRGTLPLPADYDKPIAALALRAGGKVLPTQVAVFDLPRGGRRTSPWAGPRWCSWPHAWSCRRGS